MKRALLRPITQCIPEQLKHLLRLLWGVTRPPRDPLERFKLLVALTGRLVPHYKLDWPHIDWWQDAEFNAFLARFKEDKTYNASRKFMVSQLVQLVDDVPGDTCECGVYLGASSYLICRRNQLVNQEMHSSRVHHIFDSFEGISTPTEADDTKHWQAGMLACGEEVVRMNLQEFEQVEYHPGWIPDKFHEVDMRTFCFVHVDVDLYQPTRDSLDFFYPRMNTGAILLCDDYGFDICPGATKACNEFLQDKLEKMLSLPGGGGFFIKGKPILQANHNES